MGMGAMTTDAGADEEDTARKGSDAGKAREQRAAGSERKARCLPTSSLIIRRGSPEARGKGARLK